MTSLEPILDSALKRLGGELAQLLDDDQWNNTEKRYLLPALEEQDALRAEVEALRKRCEPNHVVVIDGVGHYVSTAVNDRIAELEAALDQVHNLHHKALERLQSRGFGPGDPLPCVICETQLKALRGEEE